MLNQATYSDIMKVTEHMDRLAAKDNFGTALEQDVWEQSELLSTFTIQDMRDYALENNMHIPDRMKKEQILMTILLDRSDIDLFQESDNHVDLYDTNERSMDPLERIDELEQYVMDQLVWFEESKDPTVFQKLQNTFDKISNYCMQLNVTNYSDNKIDRQI